MPMGLFYAPFIELATFLMQLNTLKNYSQIWISNKNNV